MPNGEFWAAQFEPTASEMEAALGGFQAPTAEIQTAFTIDMRTALKETKVRWYSLSAEERVEQETTFSVGFGYKNLELRLAEAIEGVLGKYQHISDLYSMEISLAAGEYPEPFPGYGAEYLDWLRRGVDLEEEIGRLESEIRILDRNLAKIPAPSFWSWLEEASGWFMRLVTGVTPVGEKGLLAKQRYEEFTAARNVLIDRLEVLFVERSRAVLYADLYNGLPGDIMLGKITSFSDAVSHPVYAALGIAEDDEVAKSIYNNINSAILSTPEGIVSIGQPGTTIDDVDGIIALLSKPPEAIPVGMHQLTAEEILKSLTALPIPSIPGMTGEEALNMFREAGISEEDALKVESLEAYTLERETMWDNILANQEAVKAGLEEARMPEYGFKDILWNTLTQPALSALDAFSHLYRDWIAPWAAWNYRMWGHHLGALPLIRSKEETNFDAIYEEALETDDWWAAGSQAMELASMGWANRILFEWVADPLTWFGLGIYTKITRPIPLLGKAVGSAELGWLSFWDRVIFDRIKAVGKFIPRTPMQQARIAATGDFQAVAKYLVEASGGVHYRKIAIEEARDLLTKARQYALFHPEDLGDMGAAGRAMLRRTELNESEVVGLVKTLNSSYDITKDLIINVNTLLTEIADKSFGRVLTPRTAPPFLLRVLGVQETKQTLLLARKELDRIFNVGITASNNMLRGSMNTPELLANVFRNTQAAVWETLQSKAVHHLSMSGMVATQYSKVHWSVANAWRTTMDRWVVTPAARMYLAFGAYGPFNILEGYIKPALARTNPFWKHWKVNPTLKGQRTWAGVGKPMELEVAIPRIEMMGETPRMLDIERMSPALKKYRYLLSGGPIGDWFINLPAKVGLHQRWNYWDKMATRYLGTEEAPELMSKLVRTIDDAVRELPDDMLRHLNLSRGDLRQELLERTIAGPQATRGLVDDIVSDRIARTKVSKDLALEDRIAAGRTTETISKYTQIPDPIQNDIITQAADGRLWAKAGRGIDDAVEAARATMYDYFIHTPEFYGKAYKTRVKEIMALDIRNREEYVGLLRELQDLKVFYRDSTDDVMRAAKELESDMRVRLDYHKWNEWRSRYINDVHIQLQAYADTAQGSFEQVLRKLRLAQKPVGLSDDAIGHIEKLFGAWVDEMHFTKRFIVQRREAERALLATKPTRGKEAISSFWDNYFAEQSKAWDDWRIGIAPLKKRSFTEDYIISEALGTAGPPPPTINVTGRQLTKMDVADLFHGHPSNLPASMLRIETMTLKSRQEFIDEVMVQAERMGHGAGSTAKAMGWTEDAIGEVYDQVLREMYMSPQAASVMEPRLMELASLKEELWHIYQGKGLPTGVADDLQRFVDSLAGRLEKVPGYAAPVKPGVVRGLSDDFAASKQRAGDRASKEYYKDWADYTNENVTTAVMRGIYPFWTYELHRWFWLPRASIRTPGTFKGWGAYMDNTEDGYIHIPGTSLEVNPLRGTIWMGGMIRLIRRDYPEFYDRYPGISETFDFLSRFGFYPAAYINFLKVVLGTSAAGRPMFGELLPAWMKTPLNAYIAAFPDSAPAKLLLDTILPEIYRDYMTMLLANKVCQQRQLDFNGRTIWNKLKTGEKLEPEEEEIWTKASQEFGLLGILLEQGAIMRIRTQEQLDAWEQSGKLIEEKTGYTQEEQLWIRRHGFRVGDYVQLDPLDQAVLGEMDAIKYHTGTFLALMPSSWQEEDIIRYEFWHEIRTLDETLRAEGRITIGGQTIVGQEALDRLLREGKINMDMWDRGRAGLRERFSIAFDELSNTSRYKNVPITLEDIVDEEGNVIRKGMVTLTLERNLVPPVQHPAEEILNLYYSIRLEKVFDPDTGKLVDDWDGYFLQVDAIIYVLSEARREDLIDMITRSMTPLERLRWEVTRQWFRPYSRRNQAILATQFDEGQQRIVREWLFASPTRQDVLREVLMPDGKKLIATYQSMTRTAGQNLRLMNPELDGWLLFFGKTDTTLTPQAQELYFQLCGEWGIPP